jgi:thiamine biosynthesis lipoprotein
MRRTQFRAMGTTISVLLPTEHAGAASATQALFATWEGTLSRFRPESELSRLNARAGAPVAVGPLLFSALETALEAARATDGLFDPTMLRQLAILGYDRSFETLPSCQPRALAVAGPGGGWRAITLDRARHEVTLPRGCGLDLGGIAKGLAVDAAIVQLRELGVERALVNAGGDLTVLGLPPDAIAWPVTVPTRRGAQVVALEHGALATSSRSRRHWRQGHEERHHVLDPRTGTPAEEGLWSVSVGAATCAQADVAAKVALLLGPVAGTAFLERQGLSGLLVEESGARYTAGAWPAAGGEDESR